MEELINEKNDQQEYPSIKCILLGDEKVGKTTIAKIFCKINVSKEYSYTLGIDTYIINYLLNDKTIVIRLLDTSSDKRFTNIIKYELKMVNIAFLIFDITKKNSFLSLNNLINLVRSSGKTDILLILIGNKYDWENQREVNEEEIKNFCKENNILKYYQISYSNKEEIIIFLKK